MSNGGDNYKSDDDSDQFTVISLPKAAPSTPSTPSTPSRRGLPFEVSKELYQNVYTFEGNDNFSVFCNQRTDLYGTPNSSRRKSCYSKRRHFINLLRADQKKFFKLRQVYDIEEVDETAERAPLRVDTFSPALSLHLTPPSPPSPSPPPSICRQVILESPEKMSDQIPRYKLDLENPENNPHGWMAFHVAESEYKNEMVTLIVLQKHLYDMMDCLADGVKATLMDCGTMILVEEQTVPTFLGTDWKDTIRSLKKDEALHCVHMNVNRALELMLQQVNDQKLRQTKLYYLELPRDCRLTISMFNDAGDRKLKGRMNMVHKLYPKSRTLPKDITCNHAVLVYIVERDLGTRKVLRKEDDNATNELIDYFASSMNFDP